MKRCNLHGFVPNGEGGTLPCLLCKNNRIRTAVKPSGFHCEHYVDDDSFKTGDIVSIVHDTQVFTQIVLESTPETYWFSNWVGGRIHHCKDEFKDAKEFRLATYDETKDYFDILIRNGVTYTDANGKNYPFNLKDMEL